MFDSIDNWVNEVLQTKEIDYLFISFRIKWFLRPESDSINSMILTVLALLVLLILKILIAFLVKEERRKTHSKLSMKSG